MKTSEQQIIRDDLICKTDNKTTIKDMIFKCLKQ